MSTLTQTYVIMYKYLQYINQAVIKILKYLKVFKSNINKHIFHMYFICTLGSSFIVQNNTNVRKIGTYS